MMIVGYAQCKRMDDALCLFRQMVYNDLVSWNPMIVGMLKLGRWMKHLKYLRNPRIQQSKNPMIVGYAQTGQMDEALKIFEEMGERNIIS